MVERLRKNAPPCLDHHDPKPAYLENIFPQAFTQKEKSVLFVHTRRSQVANIKATKLLDISQGVRSCGVSFARKNMACYDKSSSS